MTEIKHVFFDLDHTIWDFEKNSQEALVEIFDLHSSILRDVQYQLFYPKYKAINEQYWDLYRKNKVTKEELRVGRFRDAFNLFGHSFEYDFLDQFAKDYLARSPFKTNLFADSHEVLTYLQSKYELHIITNGFKDVQYIKLRESKLAAYFNVIVCSDEVGVKKPNPAIFKFAMQKANAKPEESFMIGDCPDADVKGALAVGMNAAWFNAENKKNKYNLLEISKLKSLYNFL
ncbi:MAG: YjjG family noncanonical pyrimidine nucleotidase [Crocinitomicaceae bacterium]